MSATVCAFLHVAAMNEFFARRERQRDAADSKA